MTGLKVACKSMMEEDWKCAGSLVQAESKSSTNFCGVRNDDSESERELNHKKSKHSVGLLEVSTKLAYLKYRNKMAVKLLTFGPSQNHEDMRRSKPNLQKHPCYLQHPKA